MTLSATRDLSNWILFLPDTITCNSISHKPSSLSHYLNHRDMLYQSLTSCNQMDFKLFVR
ncbi:hypothetical protein VCHA44O286_50203 [Vibrio chagasii]|nr:hypothetical protein VCHA44O286_50203 [Vibrio chagasii]